MTGRISKNQTRQRGKSSLSPLSKPNTRRSLLKRDFVLLFLAHLFFGLAFWPYVLLPVFLQELGANLMMVGVIMGMASFAGIVVRPWVGTSLDRVGRKKILITGGLIFLSANLLYQKVDSIDWLIYLVRLLHGLGMGILMAAFFTMAADIFPNARRTEGIALFGISGHLSGMIAVPIGEVIIGLWGYDGLFAACAIFSFTSILLSLQIPDPGYHHPDGPSQSFLRLSQNPSIRIPLIATIGFAIGLTSYMVFLKPYALSIGINTVTVFFLPYTITAIVVRIIGGHWPDRFGLKRVLYPSIFLFGFGILLLIIIPTPHGLVASGILCGIGHGFIFPILSVMVIGREETPNRGSLMALFTMLFELGIFIGAPLLGWIATGGNYIPLFLTAVLVQGLTLMAFIFFKREGFKGKEKGTSRTI